MKTGLRLQCLFVITAALAVPAPQACAQAEKPLAMRSNSLQPRRRLGIRKP